MNAATPRTTVGLKVSTPSDREILMTRLFDAPRDLVFDAFTKPHLIKRWLFGPAGWSLPVCEVDLRAGGTMRYVWRHESGTNMGMRGSSAKSNGRNASFTTRSSMKTGPAVKRWSPPFFPNEAARPP